MRFGNRPGGGGVPLVGYLDEWGIWDGDLTQAQITQLFNEGNGISYFTEPEVPTVNLISPENDTTTTIDSLNFSAELTSKGYQLNNATINIWYSNGTLFTQSTNTSISGTSDINVSFSITDLQPEDYIWNVVLKYESQNSTQDNNNYTFHFVPFNTDSEYHEPSVIETSRQAFNLNVTSTEGYTVSNGQLVYNGTEYDYATKTSIDSDSFALEQIIYIPGGTTGFDSESRNFYWNVFITNEITGSTSTFTTDEYSQDVEELKFQECSEDINITLLNFTLYDEGTGSMINGSENFTTFQATFNIGAYSENKAKNFSINNFSTENSSFIFCSDVDNATIYADMVSLISAENFAERNYYLTNSTLTNETSEIPIYLIAESSALEFFITITQNLRSVADADIHVAKYFVGEGVYKTIEIDRTDSNGEFNIYLDLDRDYKATIVKDGEVLGIKTFKAACASAPCEITLDIQEEISSVFDLIDSLYAQNVLYNLSFSPETEIVTFEFVDTTGLANYFRMYVYNSNSSDDASLISVQTLYSSSGTMTFNATDYDGNFKVEAYVSRSPEILIDFITFISNEFYDLVGEYGLESLFLLFLFIVTIIFGLAFKPSVLILSIPISIHLLAIVGLFPISPVVIVVFYVLAVIGVAATFN